jgi:glycosyltransferase involved in cell wall biosynthesis
VWLGRRIGLPVVITARGTDLNYYVARFPLVRRMIRRAAEKAEGLITVCQALKDILVNLGIPDSRIQVLRNGVDLEVFRPLERMEIRRRLNLNRPTLVSVGHLIPRKGHNIAIRALSELPEMELLIVGDGPERRGLETLAEKIGVADRVRFLGQMHHTDLATVYNAADALILASSREGWANVLLEAMACGTAVVASNVWGTPEVVTCPAAGILVHDRTPKAFAEAVQQFFTSPPDRAATRVYAEMFSWEATTRGQLDLMHSVIAGYRCGQTPQLARSISR